MFGHFVSPVIAKLRHDHPLMKNELFLPFVGVTTYENFDDALDILNDVDYGLTAGIFSNNVEEMNRFQDEAMAGVLYVNRKAGATTGAWPGVQAFCGWKASGASGKGGCGPYYVAQFMREQSRSIYS
jgi:1-pyrroline-5-carboxylate dehydrogenase